MTLVRNGALTALALVSVLAAQQANAQGLRGFRVEAQTGYDQFNADGDHHSKWGFGGAAGVDFDLCTGSRPSRTTRKSSAWASRSATQIMERHPTIGLTRWSSPKDIGPDSSPAARRKVRRSPLAGRNGGPPRSPATEVRSRCRRASTIWSSFEPPAWPRGPRGKHPRRWQSDGMQSLLIATLAARWSYSSGDIAFLPYRQGVRGAIIETFAWHASRSVQHTLYAIAEVILATYQEISVVSLTLQERPYRPVDLLGHGAQRSLHRARRAGRDGRGHGRAIVGSFFPASALLNAVRSPCRSVSSRVELPIELCR